MTTVIAYNINHLNRTHDGELKAIARISGYSPLKDMFLENDPRNDTWPDGLLVPHLRATEEMKARFQRAFSDVGLPLFFVKL